MPHRRNIVLFITDQWRWDTLNDPANPARTPHLDAFRQEATNFSRAFTTVPLCTPARASLFTGKWPHQNGTLDNVQGNSFYPFGKLHPSQETYLERLAADGYRIGYVGKWHVGDKTLADRGITDLALCDGDELGLRKHPTELKIAEPSKPPFYASILDGTPEDGLRLDAGLELLRRYAKGDQPFCLVVSLTGPHFPHLVPKEWVELYDDLPADFWPDNYCPQFSETGKPAAQGAYYWPCQDTSGLTQEDWRRTVQHYWGFCSYLDHLFGRFRAENSKLGLDDSTVTAFMADHGEMLGALSDVSTHGTDLRFP